MSLFWASLQDFIPPSNCRSQLPFPTAPELLAPAFRDVNYSTHGSKWVRSSVARCRITSVSLPDLGGGRRKGENCSWNLSSCYCFSQSTVIALAELDAVGGWGEKELGARSWGCWGLRFSTLKILPMAYRLFGIKQLAVLLPGGKHGTSGAKPEAGLLGAVVSPLSPKVGRTGFFCFCKESQNMARNPDCSPCLETVSHKTHKASEYMRFFFLKQKYYFSPIFMVDFEEVAVPGLQSLWESVWEALLPIILDLSRFLLDL